LLQNELSAFSSQIIALEPKVMNIHTSVLFDKALRCRKQNKLQKVVPIGEVSQLQYLSLDLLIHTNNSIKNKDYILLY